MPDYDPPAEFDGTPHRFLLPPDSLLWHVHPKTRKATEFTPYRPGRRHAGRFDGTEEDPYPAYNAARSAPAALADVLLGSIPSPTKGFRTLRRVGVAGLRLSLVLTAVELSLVTLCDATDLNAVAQDVWLIRAEDSDLPRVRRWASWVRKQAPWAEGFLWPPKRDPGRHCVVLFGDRCDSGVFQPNAQHEVDLDDEFGAAYLNGMLAEYRVWIAPPRPPR
ncbi:RES family NAD+ phosphorylase [Amycolatopsis cynarae]|uniref:RES family NAD+ phosphorylase n=1 Tax=Amycolatopsis cynarae TaxID=2995223 RepID=A0ABY7AV81_9PSEU|nr:RES family NAD+ phosphorylase [Amycolatopsis sp. HUAS 11-8]WAL63885.1 RES family NAD+ phosphorylase [Amycolatopsis sp. HUAS 11-8]